jgi:hypothetical protein
MARLRRMYARPLFVVVGISGAVLPPSRLLYSPFVVRKAPFCVRKAWFCVRKGRARLGIAGACGYTLAP